MRIGDHLRAASYAAVIVLIIAGARTARGDASTPLEIAYAGSMGSLMDGGVRPAIAKALGAELKGRAQGSSGLANLIIAGSIRPDVFIAVTPGPMRNVLAAGKATRAIPIARSEMVIAYSPHSKYAGALAKSGAAGAEPWWKILETPGLHFARTDPLTDPQGANIIFTMQLAEKYYAQPGLAAKILGPQINPQQIFNEPEVMARLQSGQLDASSAYKTQPSAFGLPFLTLPPEINLGDAAMAHYYQAASIELKGKAVHPSPLVFYAAVLKDAPHPQLATRFVDWLGSAEARAVLAHYYYDEPGNAQPLTP